VTIKSLLFCLFLYVCLVWVGAAYLYTGPDIPHYGLLWTAIGLIAVLAFIILARVYSWWRSWQVRRPARPAAPATPVAAAHPGDEAMSALIAEANTVLAKAPSFTGRPGVPPIATLPLYLLVGPEGSGKTSTFLNSGLEPQLLAGQGIMPVAPTRVSNIWLAKNAIFVEIGGRAFGENLGRWSQLIDTLRGHSALPLWRRIWGDFGGQMDLRGVIAFCDSKELTGASSDPQRLERYGRDWQERLRAIAEQFGSEFMVYFVVTKCDKIPFFSDFFRRLPESQAGQVLGSTLEVHTPQASRPSEVFVEAEAKRLTASFRPLYHALAQRRLSHLAHEPNPAGRPGVYEFPRELRRIRSPLVQLLTDVFRPYQLGPSPALRGYYLTGVREAAVEALEAAGHRMDAATQAPMEATRLFRGGDATQIFQPEDATKLAGPGGRMAPGPRWLFVSDLFHRVVLTDAPPRKTRPVETRMDRYRRLAFGAVSGLCVLVSLAFIVSWIRNRNLLADVAAAASSQANRQGRATTLADLRALEGLRLQLARLQGHFPLSYHWGLYSGDAVLDQVRTAYFRQFQRLLLVDLNSLMAADLDGLPANPDANAPYDPVYRTLKAHLMITSGSCTVDSPFVASQLKEARARIAPGATVDWQVLADRQIDFYASELTRGNPLRLVEDAEGRDRARRYLQQIKGLDRYYASILANAAKSLGSTSRLSDLASNYEQVLNGPNEVSSAFSREGWDYFGKASTAGNSAALGEPCVVGGGGTADWKQNAETSQAVQRMYLRDYVDHWRKFVEGFSVARYTSAADAARKLEILADHKSPLLALLALTANHTNFPSVSGRADTGILQKGIDKLLAPVRKGESQAKSVVSTPEDTSDTLNSPTDIPRYFQPVHWVEPPGSETWVVDKNAMYIDALAALRRSMQEIAQGGRNPDAAVHGAAAQNYEKAMDAVRQIARGFKPVGVGSLDATVEHLLAEPIRLTNSFIIKDIGRAGTDQVNRDLRNFCISQRSTMRKYPFQAASGDDAALEEFSALLEPARGAIWKLAQQSLGDFAVREGSQWKSKDPTKKPQVTPEMLGFLNRAQAVADAFYPSGSTPPQLTYTLRPKLDSRLKEFKLELAVDGRPFLWNTSLQHQFTWPAPPGSKDVGAVVRLRLSSGAGVSIASRGGIWGIFKILGDAEPRDLGAKLVEWRYTSSGVGRREPIQPAPVEAEIVGFPGGQDVFNAKFWEGLRCPTSALQ
jgi:type VI secretion system protein ImpL